MQAMERFVLTRDAVERTRRTIHAAEVLHDRARAIARICTGARAGQVVVAVVEPDGVFGGAWPIERAEVSDRLGPLEDGGWTLLFDAGTGVAEIEERSMTMARLAFRRWEAMRRWAARHA
jgi:hypothetical protein